MSYQNSSDFCIPSKIRNYQASMKNGVTLKVIIEKRSDAIYVYSKAIIQKLKEKYLGIEVITVDNRKFKSPFLNILLEVLNTIKIIFLIRRKDIVLFTDPLPLNFLSSLFIKNKKFSLFFHYEESPLYYKFLPFLSFKNTLDLFDGIICSSNYSLSQLHALGINNKRCRVIYGGIDHQLFKPVSKKFYPFEYILSVGSEEPRKNMENILKSFKILIKDFPQIKLLKVGKASEKNRRDTMHWIENLQLTESVVFTDYVQEDKLSSIYSGAKLLLFPSFLEGFGLPVVEAMACGCPVVTSNLNPLQELISTKQRAVNPNNPREIAQECKNILTNQRYRSTIIKNGLLRVKEFNWEETASGIYDYVTKKDKTHYKN